MAKPGSEIQGLTKLLKKLDQFPPALQKEIDMEVQASGLTIQRNALRRAPIDKGGLRRQITYKKAGIMQAEVISGAKYSGYQEFGTGTHVNIPAQPPGVEEIALAMKGRGIRRVNINPHPFFFNSYNEEKPLLLERIERIIEQELGK